MRHSPAWAGFVIVLLALPLATTAVAEPIDTWELLVGIDCVGDRFNPVREDGTKDPNGDPKPGTPEWIARDNERLQCDNQRDHDRRVQPFTHVGTARYGEDWYRQPFLHDGVRFHFDYFPTGTGPGGVPAMEVYRPCSNAPGDCPNLPEGLQRFDAPYPVVIVHHGFIAQMSHHRFNAQAFAEAGYLAISVNGTHPVTGAPNVQRNVNAGLVMEWLASDASGEIGDQADLERIATVGHSQGAAAALSYQGDPRVDTIIAWDGGDGIADNNTSQPIMYQRTDGAFSAPQATARTDYPAGRDRGLETYLKHKERGMDVYHVTFRATNHIDWNGNGVGSLAGNRLAELVINYYSLAWLDRHLKGLLAFDSAGSVITYEGRTEAEERAYRQAQAQDAFDRLTAMKFDDSADIHNISMGFYDPVKHATSGDPLYGGNVPYSIEGLWVTDRLSQEFRSFCSVSVPDYVGGSDGSPGSPVVVSADSGTTGDIRFTGCTVVDQLIATTMTLSVDGQGANRTLSARLSTADDSATAVPGRLVHFYADGKAIGSATTNNDGVATLAVPRGYRGSAKHLFEARFDGDEQYTSASARSG
jgi:pimeloyl-ACP methyl ester carboxylesterase